jgi:hypothetical protein
MVNVWFARALVTFNVEERVVRDTGNPVTPVPATTGILGKERVTTWVAEEIVEGVATTVPFVIVP